MVFAVVTLNAVIVYDTQSRTPLALVEDTHFSELTDLSWLASLVLTWLTLLAGAQMARL